MPNVSCIRCGKELDDPKKRTYVSWLGTFRPVCAHWFMNGMVIVSCEDGN